MNDVFLSIIVIAHNMPAQLTNTLHTLSVTYQKSCKQREYEVIIVENLSENVLDEGFVQALPDNFRYFLRQEKSQSPAAAINFALEQVNGQFVGLLIDGAHMLTPGVITLVKDAATITDKALITVPAYHLGPAEQHISSKQRYDAAEEKKLLDKCCWAEDGYQLFTIASWCGANPRGYFAPIMESNCYFAPREAFEEIGGADLEFQQPGGGALNLHMTRRLGLLPGSVYFTLIGEGSFHQFHGGVTSNQSRTEFESQFDAELQRHWDNKYRFLERNPIMLGSIKPQALDNMIYSAEKMLRRFDNCRANRWEVWADDNKPKWGN